MRVVVAMSGGVDSSVAALILKKQGYDVVGVTMKTWPSEDCGHSEERVCCSLSAIQYARSAAEDLNIPHYTMDFSEEFSREVRDYFLKEYSMGRTPNPCIFCNSRMKFGHLLRKARTLGSDMIATGHYARIERYEGAIFLKEAVEKRKDQSYFLSGIPKIELGSILFPLGDMRKDDVRKLARDNNLMSADRPSSQDICFTVPGSDYRDYIAKKGLGGLTPGNTLDVKGNVIGTHSGIASYTIGQRRGLGLGVHVPLYVIAIDPKNNTITVGSRVNAMKSGIKAKLFNWLLDSPLQVGDSYKVRIRYNGIKSEAVIKEQVKDEIVLGFSEKQFAPTPGQAAVLYKNDIVAGAAWIEDAF